MDDKKYIKTLEDLVKQMLTPLKNIPFNLVIESMTGNKVLPFNKSNSDHKKVLKLLKKSAIEAGNDINLTGIERPRPNEVGNDIEKFVLKHLNRNGLNADIPTGPSGNKKSTGYPDILFIFNDLPYYVECKTYNIENIATTQRSFYMSPSDEFKVIHTAPHLLLSYEIYVAGEHGKNHIYKCRHFKLLSLESLPLDVKYEFNSDNKRMYSGHDGCILLDEGKIE
jgi:hypothetical protein